MRIALRRLRCAFAMLRSLAPSAKLESLRADAKWFASTLMAARALFRGAMGESVGHHIAASATCWLIWRSQPLKAAASLGALASKPANLPVEQAIKVESL
jgi:hypothetical protein